MAACHSGASWLRAPQADGEPFLDYRRPPTDSDRSTGLGQLGPRVAQALRQGYGAIADRAPPVSLTPTDGSELAIRALDADIQIRGPLAHTELHFVFHNAESRIREGRFAIAMPPGAAVSRFAMKIGDTWREARIVSRTQGRAVYETYLHHRVDPALLERDADNRFSARVFPIAGDADKEIRIAYDHAVGASAPYVLALRGLPAVPLALTIDQDGAVTQRTSKDAPDDVVLAVSPGNAALAGETAFVARVELPAAAVPAPLDHVLVLVDTSASRAAIMHRQAEAVRRLLDRLPAGAEVAVAVFDHTVQELYRGRARDARGVAEAVLEHGALGASRLAAALDHAVASRMARVVLIGDAVATLGERDPARLAAIVRGTAVGRVDVVQLGQAIDLDAARAITAAGRSPGAILDGRDLDRVARQLARAVPAAEPITVAGASAIWPATTRGVAPGDPIFVYGLYDAAPPEQLAVTIGDLRVNVAAPHGDAVQVRRAVASAELAALGEALAATTDPAAAAALRSDIERVALAHGLVSSQSSLLTLESDADEQRMLGPPPAATNPGPGDASQAPPLSDEELARLAAQESKTEVITVTGALISRSEGETSAGISVVDREHIDDASTNLGPLLDHEPSWGEPSWQRPSIILHRDRTPYTPPGEEPEPEPEPEPTPPVTWARGRSPAAPPYVGALGDVMRAIAQRDLDAALVRAVRARFEAPEDVAAILALGEALEARGAGALAARAYGSLVDLFPSRDDLTRAAGERLDRIGGPARELAVDAYRRALDERPDRAVSYRRLGYALARLGRWDEAVDVLVGALPRIQRQSITRIVRDDVGLIAAAAIEADPDHAAPLRARLAGLGIAVPTTSSLRFVLSWETDANDVDLHVRDRHGEEAYYAHPTLFSGGELLDDVTDGFGPEMLVIESPDGFPYRIGAHYYARGPEGVGLGTIQIVRHDGHGHLTIEDRPFALQIDDGMIDLGSVTR
ncbi:MAG TPA: VIT domain-containing protein [Kofleriaceae bacterium]|nr:VIT domain-containing protein [Kofleriaceae bacterium]